MHAPLASRTLGWGSCEPTAWKEAARRLRRWTPPAATTLAHRDLHPGNILWQHGGVTGVVDWPNACLAPPAVDAGTCMADLAILHGVEAAWRFHAGYEARTGQGVALEWILIGAFELTADGLAATEIVGWTGEPDLVNDVTLVARRLDAHVAATLER